MEDKKHYCERKAYAHIKYFPNLDHPTTYNEKNIWLALHYKDDRIRTYADKYEVKDYISQKVGPQYCVPTIGVYENVNDIDMDALPDRFVLKSTAGWGSKQVILVRDKKSINTERVKSQLSEWLYPWNNYYYNNLCITNECIKPRIIIEEYLEQGGGNAPLIDYKVHCFNGKARYVLIVENRNTKEYKKTFFDLADWSIMPITRKGARLDKDFPRPRQMDEIVEISERLSAGFPLVRIDFYVVGDQVYVGEMTFSPGMFLQINPREWDKKLGELINIENISKEKRGHME
ncbi:MAG: ATP-grasp fold amidoligase family protein [Clostridia bacterium]